MSAGGDVNSRDRYGWTPLMEASYNAAYRDHTSLVQLLLTEGADIDAISKDGSTALMLAAERKPDIVRVLLANRASAQLEDSRGHTALSIAQWAGNKRAVHYLEFPSIGRRRSR